MLVLDTNVLLYAANDDSEFQSACAGLLEECRRDPSPTFLTWRICYEFLRVATHRRIFPSPLTAAGAWSFLRVLLDSPGFGLLRPTERHARALARICEELPELRGNDARDLHTAVLMREHGIGRICTRDTDFHRFPFLTVVDPLRLA